MGKVTNGEPPTFGEYPCYKCGKSTHRRCRLDDSGKLDVDAPFRAVCDDCGPKWKLISRLTKDGEEPLTDEDREALKDIAVVE